MDCWRGRVLAVVAGLVIGLTLSGNSTQATAQIPHNSLTESVPTANPVDASLAPAAPEFGTIVESEGGSPQVSGQADTPNSVEICYTDLNGQEICRDPTDDELLEDWNPVRTQHTFTIRVRQANGAPAANVPVEIILNRFGEAVGDIVSIEGGAKVDNTFGNVTTNAAGEADFVITATREGDTDVTAYVPSISDDDVHKVFAVKHWVDMDVICPPAMDTNQAGDPHDMKITVFKATRGFDVNGQVVEPLPDREVTWRITDNDPSASFVSGSNVTQETTTTSADGEATLTLYQVTPAAGDNEVTISVVDENDRPMFNCTVLKNWVAGQLGITKTASADMVNIGETVMFTIEVENLNSEGSLTNVNITDAFPFDGFDTTTRPNGRSPLSQQAQRRPLP